MPGDREHGALTLRQLRGARRAGGRAGRHELAQQVAGQPGPRERICERRPGGQVEQPGSRGERELGHVASAESPHDPLGHVQPARRGAGGRAVVGQPAQLRHGAQRARGQARRLGEPLGAEIPGEAQRLVASACVVPGDCRRERTAPAVEQSTSLRHARHARGRGCARPARRPALPAQRQPPPRTAPRTRPPLPWAAAARESAHWPCERSTPSRPTTAALQAEVPTSMPSRRSVMPALPRLWPVACRPPRLRPPRAGRCRRPTAPAPCRRGRPRAARRPRSAARRRPW